MRRRTKTILASWALAAAWLGCNALLGNEPATFEPPAADGSAGEGSRPADGGPVDATPDVVDDGRDAGAGPCVDVASDPRHCGACGHDCLGSSCVGGRCQPVTLANDRGKPEAIALDATHVYWTNVATGDVLRVPMVGGAVEVVYDGPDTVSPGFGFSVYADYVYFSGADAVVRCPVTGCAGAPEVVVPGLVSPQSVTIVGAGSLAFTEFTPTGRVGRCTLPCGGNVDFVASSYPLRATVAGDRLFWSTLIGGGPGQLFRRDGADAPVPISSALAPYELVVASDELLIADLGDGPRAVPIDGGSLRRLTATGTSQGRYLAYDDDGGDVFFTDTKGLRVVRCSLSGCGDAGAVLAPSQVQPAGVAAEARYVFWVDQTGSDAGVIWRVAK